MKKILLTLLSIFILVPVIGILNSEEVKALGQSEMACSAFEVDYINDDGSFTNKGCYDSFDSAKSYMKSLGGDHVIRHAKSLSYTKIVAMNSGIAYSYPRWGSTLSIYQNLYNQSIYYKSTYVSRHYEMDYVDTSLVGVGSKGYMYGMIEVNVMGFHGYCDLENSDLVPSKFIRNGIKIWLGGNNSYTGEGFFSIVPKQNYFENNSGDLVFHMYYGYSSDGTNAQSYSFTIGKASESMSSGVKYYSYNGYDFYTNDTFTDNKITYYNYYQFLPLRSKTNVTADMLNSYISNKGYSKYALGGTGQYFIDAQNKYGINALILFAMAIHESGHGTSGYAMNRHNLFGWNAYDSDPSQASYFSSVQACVNEQAGINLRGFVDITDGRFFSSSLGNKGSGLNVKYASDPYWGMKIASYCYAIDKNYNNSQDINRYSLSLINTFDINVYNNASKSKVLYTTQYGPYYQENFIVITLGSEGTMTKIQSTNPIDSSGNIQTHRTPITTGTLNPISYGEYDFDRSIAYVDSSYLTLLNSGTSNTDNVPVTPNITPVIKEKKAYSGIDELTLSSKGELSISGYAYIEGIDFSNIDDISFILNIKNVNDDEIYKSYQTVVSEYEGIMFDDGNEYKYVGYSISIPTADIINEKDFTGGVYYLSIDINNGDYSMSSTLSSTSSKYSNLNYNYQDYSYRITTNSRYLNRIELTIESMPSVIDYTSINKKYLNIDSFFSFDSLSVDEDGNFVIDGQGLIYYLNYNNKDDVTYKLYLVNDKDSYIEIPCDIYASPDLELDKKILKTSYDVTYTYFKANVNLLSLSNNELKSGYYSMILMIKNGNYIDYVELNTLRSINSTNGNYRLFKSNVRNRLMLEVKEDIVVEGSDATKGDE